MKKLNISLSSDFYKKLLLFLKSNGIDSLIELNKWIQFYNYDNKYFKYRIEGIDPINDILINNIEAVKFLSNIDEFRKLPIGENMFILFLEKIKQSINNIDSLIATSQEFENLQIDTINFNEDMNSYVRTKGEYITNGSMDEYIESKDDGEIIYIKKSYSDGGISYRLVKEGSNDMYIYRYFVPEYKKPTWIIKSEKHIASSNSCSITISKLDIDNIDFKNLGQIMNLDKPKSLENFEMALKK